MSGPRNQPRLPIVSVATTLAAVTAAHGQQDSDVTRRLERQLRELDVSFRLTIPRDQPIAERLTLDYGGSQRFALLGVDDEFGSTRVLRQSDTVLYLRAELDRAHRFFGRLRFLYDDFNSGDSFDGRGDGLDQPIGDRWWYQFDLRGAAIAERGERIDHNVNVKVGRQFVEWGSGMALSEVLYGGVLDVELGAVGLVGLGGITPASSTVDFDGSRPGFDSQTERAFYGGRIEHRGIAGHRPYLSFLAQRDENDRDSTVFETPIGDFPTDFEYDSEYWAIGSRGAIDSKLSYRVELIHQTGEALSSPIGPGGAAVQQTTEDIEAWAGLAGLSWTAGDDADTRIDLVLAGGSGDDDRLDSGDTFGGNLTGTDDNAFNALGYVSTGLALAPELSNLLMLQLTYSTSPVLGGTRNDWLRLGVSGFLFAKADRDAPLNIATTDSTFVGGEIDLALDWRLASDLTLGFRYGIFLPGDAMPDGQDSPRHFVYAGITYAF